MTIEENQTVIPVPTVKNMSENLSNLISLPVDWTPMNSNTEFEIVKLKHNDSMYKRIKSDFVKSLSLGCTIISIERIQNPDLYIHFRA